MRPSLYEYAGGERAFLALAAAHHERCLEDPELNHPFSHPGQHPQHVERLALYWGEVLGGPPRFTEECSTQTRMLRMHAGNGDLTDLGERFKLCFARAMDDAGLSEDTEFRDAMNAYMGWAVADVLAHEATDDVPPRAAMPHWDWDGLRG